MSTRFRKMFWGSSFVQTPLKNGIGRYIPQLQRVTIKFCKSSGGSRGSRDYIEQNLIEYARENPNVVVYVKPRRHRSSCLKAEYLNGHEEYISTHNMTREDIVKWMDYLRLKTGASKLLEKDHHTDFPSIQGPWTPFVHKDPTINISQFPNESLSAYEEKHPSGTEELIEIYRKQLSQQETKSKD